MKDNMTTVVLKQGIFRKRCQIEVEKGAFTDVSCFWDRLHNYYCDNILKCRITADAIVLYTTLEASYPWKNDSFSISDLPVRIPDKLVFEQQLMRDRDDPVTGYRIYEALMFEQGSISFKGLSQKLRRRFIKSLLTNPSDISIKT